MSDTDGQAPDADAGAGSRAGAGIGAGAGVEAEDGTGADVGTEVGAETGPEVGPDEGRPHETEAVSVEEIDAELAALAAESAADDQATPMERWTRIAFAVGWAVLGVLAVTEGDVVMLAGSVCGALLAGAQLAVGHRAGLRVLVDRLVGWRLWKDLTNLAFLVLVLALSVHNDVGAALLTIVSACCAISLGIAAATILRRRRHA